MSATMMMIMLMSSLMFMLMKHPLSFGALLLIQTTFSALITGSMNFNYWFSYILFLIMIGGMLILFMYMTSVASNEMFKFSTQLFFIWMIGVTLILGISLIDSFMFSNKLFNCSLINQSSSFFNTLSMSKFMNFPANLNLIMIMLYLLITLIAIVKITNISYGPLREKF